MVDFRDYETLAGEPWKWWMLGGFCVTFVRGITGSDFLDLVGARIVEPVVHGEEEFTLARPSELSNHHFAGVTDALDGWMLAIESVGGYMGTSIDVIGKVAAQRDVVSIYGAEGSYGRAGSTLA